MDTCSKFGFPKWPLCCLTIRDIPGCVSFKCMDDNFGGTTLRLCGVKERKAGTPLWSRFTKTELPTSLPVSSVGLYCVISGLSMGPPLCVPV